MVNWFKWHNFGSLLKKLNPLLKKLNPFSIPFHQYLPYFFLLPYFPYIKNVNELIHRVSVLMILTGNESLVVEKIPTANRIAHFHVFLSLGKYRRITKPPTTYRHRPPTTIHRLYYYYYLYF